MHDEHNAPHDPSCCCVVQMPKLAQRAPFVHGEVSSILAETYLEEKLRQGGFCLMFGMVR